MRRRIEIVFVKKKIIFFSTSEETIFSPPVAVKEKLTTTKISCVWKHNKRHAYI